MRYLLFVLCIVEVNAIEIVGIQEHFDACLGISSYYIFFLLKVFSLHLEKNIHLYIFEKQLLFAIESNMSYNPNSRLFPSHEDSSHPVAIRAGLSVQVIILTNSSVSLISNITCAYFILLFLF